MDYYAHRLMIRRNSDNHILKYRQLFHQYIVDMFAKIETERLLYIRLNQAKLRADDYIHLRDAIQNDANVDELGTMVILQLHSQAVHGTCNSMRKTRWHMYDLMEDQIFS